MPPKTQLAAIMFTDIEGYSALTSTNEAKALQMVEMNRQLQKPIIKKYGTFIKEMGDGMLARFNSAVDAIACAQEIQDNATSLLKDKIRIGIHLGEISEENGDVLGDGVNIASRIESIAEPGTIYISESVYSAIKSRNDIQTEFVGEKDLKNIPDPVKCYKVTEIDNGIFKSEKRQVNLALWVSVAVVFILMIVFVFKDNKESNVTPSVIILPFQQVNLDSSNQYLKLGIAEELIRSLGNNNQLFVINNTTTTRYMASLNPFEQAREDLNEIVDYYVNGNYSLNNNQITLNFKLLTRDEKELISKSFRKDRAFLPELVFTMATEISNAIDSETNRSNSNKIPEIKNIDPEVYSLYLKGMTILGRYEFSEYPVGISYLEQAKDMNPTNARAWAGLAEGYVWLGHAPNPPPPGAWEKAKSAAIRAIQLDSTNAEAWAALAHTKTYFEWDYEGARIAYQKSNKINPSNAFNHYHYAWHLYLLDSLDKAIEEHKIAKSLDPFEPIHTFWLGGLYISKGEYIKAKKELYEALEVDSNSFVSYNLLSDVYRLEGKMDSAKYTMDKAMELQPMMRYFGYPDYLIETGNLDEVMLLVQEMKSYPPNPFLSFIMARTYARLDSADQFFYYANYEPTHAFHPWLRKAVTSENILRDPRFKLLMDKFNLPMPTNPDQNF